MTKSDLYYNEEIKAYNEILNDIIDTSSYYRYIKEHDAKLAVFFLFDSLSSLDNNDNKTYLETKLESRKFSIEKLKGIQKYIFKVATKYPKDTVIGTSLHTMLQDSLKLGDEEWFSNKWLTLSRICFNSTLTKGLLHYYIWCGSLCSSENILEIEKKNNRWVTVKIHKGAVS